MIPGKNAGPYQRPSQRSGSNNGRMNFAQQAELALKNDRRMPETRVERSNSRGRPVTQEEIRSALTLLKAKQRQKMETQGPFQMNNAPLPQLRKAQSELEHMDQNSPNQYYEPPRRNPQSHRSQRNEPNVNSGNVPNNANNLINVNQERVQQYQQRPPAQNQAPPMNEFEDDDENEPVEECPEGCGRKFKQSALEKHMRICKKVFQQQRKKFDTKEHRIIGEEHAKILKEAEKKEKCEQKKAELQQKKQNIEDRPIQGQKKPKWKAQSEAFRAMLKISKGDEVTAEQQAAFKEAMQAQDTRVYCEFCERKFNPEAAQKHIPLCQQKAKVNQIKKNGTVRKGFSKK